MIVIFLNYSCSSSSFFFFPDIHMDFLFNQTSHFHKLIKVSHRLLQRTIVIYKSTFSVKSKYNKANFRCWLCYSKLAIVLPNPLVKRNPCRLWKPSFLRTTLNTTWLRGVFQVCKDFQGRQLTYLTDNYNSQVRHILDWTIIPGFHLCSPVVAT